MTGELMKLAERVEQATTGNRELDCLIGYAVNLHGDDKHLSFRKSFDICGLSEMVRVAESHQNIWRAELPRYTSSLDAAVSLVPEGLSFGCGSRDATNTAWAWVGKHDGNISASDTKIANAATPALALTAANLKARALARDERGER